MQNALFLEADHEAMSRRCAQLIAEAVSRKPDALLSLAAGNTAIRTYAILKEMCDAGQLDLRRARFAALDEWLDLDDESENCNAFMHTHFYGPLGIDEDRITRFDIHAKDLAKACKDMDEAILAHGGLDLMLLGMGMNGHLGLNEPGASFADHAVVTQLSGTTMQVGQKYFTGSMTLTRGITLGIGHILECRQVILQISGRHKAEITDKLLRSAPTEALPATALKLHANGTLVLDREAASLSMDILEEYR